MPGPGGLPVGVTGRVELLLSGGIDSPVAGWLMLKRGCALGATYFHSFPYTGEKTQDKVARLARSSLRGSSAAASSSVVPFTDVQKALRDASGDGRLAVVLYRRMMMRIAERIAQKAGAKALATGEALAQVASQTLENLGVIGASTTMPVLRPCLGHDKLETDRHRAAHRHLRDLDRALRRLLLAVRPRPPRDARQARQRRSRGITPLCRRDG